MKTLIPTGLALACAYSFNAIADTQQTETLPTVTVTADYRQAEAISIPASITIIDKDAIAQRNAKHLEEILNQAANVNFSGGSSRARYYQIRGIGERSQFIEPLNASVGVIVDDMDFSGIGSGGTLLDIDQVEILRGPQGTRYGANALAGLIYMKSADPTEDYTGGINVSAGEYDSYQLSAVTSGPITENLLYRIAVEENRSDGYIENDFLNRDDTNNLDEFTARGKLQWQVNDTLTLDITALHVDIDNGYDAFSLDNNRHTLSDDPGHDRQQTTALSIKASYRGNEYFDSELIFSGSDSDLEYGYDEDWSYPDICSGLACDGWAYTSFDNYQRDRKEVSAELRLISKDSARLFNNSTDWVVGIYSSSKDEELLREYTFSDDFISDYDTDKYSIFFQLDTQLSERLTLTTGLRYERHEGDYQDNDGVDFDVDEDLWGGSIALEYMLDDNTLLYGLISRGYKSGGVNSNSSLTPQYRDFDTESMINYETGIKSSWLNDTLRTQLAFFYQDRDDVQVKQSAVIPISGNSCPCQFIDYTSNAAQGLNYGLEAQLQWQATEALLLTGSLGILETEFEDFVNADSLDLDGREQAHAPAYQFSIAGLYQFTEQFSARLEVEGKDEFYFSDRHQEQSDAFEVWNGRLSYATQEWELALWGRNLLDKDYQVRGFGNFGNDPRNFYETEPYYQFGAPRTLGISGRYSF